jgi:hypothetical protein
VNITGIVIGIFAFAIIGVFHPVVIKTEYHFGKKVWPLFLVTGIAACIISLFVKNNILSPLFAVLGFTLFWSIRELHEQERRVQKGWFPINPKRRKQ